jgi:hypothetical protein
MKIPLLLVLFKSSTNNKFGAREHVESSGKMICLLKKNEMKLSVIVGEGL